jgi:hypothetical protein
LFALLYSRFNERGKTAGLLPPLRSRSSAIVAMLDTAGTGMTLRPATFGAVAARMRGLNACQHAAEHN